jgi:hypothetical protein
MRSPGYTPLLCMRMCQLQSAHQQEFESDTPKRIFSIFRTAEVFSGSKCRLEITSRDNNSDLTFFYCCENDRMRDNSGILRSDYGDVLHNSVAIMQCLATGLYNHYVNRYPSELTNVGHVLPLMENARRPQHFGTARSSKIFLHGELDQGLSGF